MPFQFLIGRLRTFAANVEQVIATEVSIPHR